MSTAERRIFDAKKEYQNSRYKILNKTQKPDFEETLYEIIRLSYVGLFHKLENYVNDVLRLSDLVFDDVFETEGSVAKWAKDNFRFDFKDWRQFFITERINWICNCVKHYDGFPIKEPKPIGFRYSDEKIRIKISPEEFKQDCDSLISFYPVYMQMIQIFSAHKKLFEKPLIKEEWEHNIESYNKQLEAREKMESLVQEFLKIFVLKMK